MCNPDVQFLTIRDRISLIQICAKGISKHSEANFSTPLSQRAVTGWVVKMLIIPCSMSNTPILVDVLDRILFFDTAVWYGSIIQSYAVEACQHRQ
jgi:hypothetical protein